MNISAWAALATALCWAVTAICFEYSGKRIGALTLNFLRLILGSLFLGLYLIFTGENFWPFEARISEWLWLGLSGLIGLMLGDLLLFQAFIYIGSRVTMLIYAFAPALGAILSFAIFLEQIKLVQIFGMFLTLIGIALVVLSKKKKADELLIQKHRLKGIIFAFLAALAQALGLILAKPSSTSLNAFQGTQIRVSAAIVGFLIMFIFRFKISSMLSSLRDIKAMSSLALGSFFGPFLGVSLSLLAIQKGSIGVASAIFSIVPVILFLPSILIFKEKFTPRELFYDICGSLIAIAGVFILFLIK